MAAVGDSPTLTAAAWMKEDGWFTQIGSATGHTAAVHSRAPQPSGLVGDIAGFGGGSGSLTTPAWWPEGLGQAPITVPGLPFGRALRINASQRIIGYAQSSLVPCRPFVKTGSVVTLLDRDIFSYGQAQAIDGSNVIAGWIGDDPTSGYVCYWLPDLQNPGQYGPAQIVDIVTPLTGEVMEVFSTVGSTPVTIMGFTDSQPGRLFWWNSQVGPFKLLGKSNEAGAPSHAVKNAFVGNTANMPFIFLFDPSNVHSGDGLADDLNAILTPVSPLADVNTMVTGVAGADSETSMGGVSLGDAKNLWMATPSNLFRPSDLLSVTKEVGFVTSFQNPIWSAAADGKAYRVGGLVEPDPDGDNLRILFDHAFTNENLGNKVFRVTSRFSVFNFRQYLDLYNWGTQQFDLVRSDPLKLYMQTRDAGIGPQYVLADSNGYHIRARVRIRQDSFTNGPSRLFELEQALGIQWGYWCSFISCPVG